MEWKLNIILKADNESRLDLCNDIVTTMHAFRKRKSFIRIIYNDIMFILCFTFQNALSLEHLYILSG